jgi:hypothetical protein
MRHRSTYRAWARNTVKAAGQLALWRRTAANKANAAAKLHERAKVAEGAREAVQRVLVANPGAFGKRRDTLIASAMLGYYSTLLHKSRPVSRIIRELCGKQVLA